MKRSEIITTAQLTELARTRPNPFERAILNEYPALVAELKRRRAAEAELSELAEQATAALGRLSLLKAEQAEREETITATLTPSAPDDVAVLRNDASRTASGCTLDGGVQLPRGLLSYIGRDKYEELTDGEAVVADRGAGVRHHHIVYCEQHADLRTMIVRGVEAAAGPDRLDLERELDGPWVDQVVAEVIDTTRDRGLLLGWLEAAGDQDHAPHIHARLTRLFGAAWMRGGTEAEVA